MQGISSNLSKHSQENPVNIFKTSTNILIQRNIQVFSTKHTETTKQAHSKTYKVEKSFQNYTIQLNFPAEFHHSNFEKRTIHSQHSDIRAHQQPTRESTHTSINNKKEFLRTNQTEQESPIAGYAIGNHFLYRASRRRATQKIRET